MEWQRTRSLLDAAHDVTAKCEPYALVRVNGNGAGKERFGCPACWAKVRCPLRAFTNQLPDSILEVTPPTGGLLVKNGICERQTITVPGDVSPKTRQRHPWMSDAWRNEYARRPAVERAFASLKHAANEDVGRGWIELFGLVDTSLMLALAAMSQNLRLALKFIADHGPEPEDVVLRGPTDFYGHEETNEFGQIELYTASRNPNG